MTRRRRRRRSSSPAVLLVAIVAAAGFFWPELKERLPELEEIAGTAPSREAGGGTPAPAGLLECHVTSVYDGDGPIHCAEGPKIRLSAIAAREMDGSCRPGHPCPTASADEAKAALERLALGQTLRCEQTGTSYDRVTAWCWRPDGVQLNCAMVEGGYAARWERYDVGHRLCSRPAAG
ncbi:thermonuclease family protein [Sphingomonas sp. ac-8]|uniref:thermonuclease family protein n=1 Tax=Sphingomonas sp. ac-8 TaxID=3242977 RepID=UPI003A80A511